MTGARISVGVGLITWLTLVGVSSCRSEVSRSDDAPSAASPSASAEQGGVEEEKGKQTAIPVPVGWVLVRQPSFATAFPVSPVIEDTVWVHPSGSVMEGTLFMAEDGESYGVTVSPLGGSGVEMVDPALAFAQARESLLFALGGRLERERHLGAPDGLDLTIVSEESRGGDMVYRVRLIVHGAKLYQIMVALPTEAYEDPDRLGRAEAFLQAFTLL